MKNLNEFNAAYPSVIGNAQSQEYQGALGPVDAETVQGNDRLNPKTPEGLHRINNFISHFFRRITLNPQNDVAQLRVRLNHLTLDFPFDNTKPIEAVNEYPVTFGGSAFGVTPTTDLALGFDNGADLPRYNLEIRSIKTDSGFKLEGKLTPENQIAESIISNARRESRINKMKKIVEQRNEASRAEKMKDPTGETARGNRNQRKLMYKRGNRR
jgi:hypothetical protein